MKPERYRLLIVLAGINHNPTILSADFLEYNEIVPSGLTRSETNPPILTAAFARVVYNEGLEIQSDPDKVHFAQVFANPQDAQIATKCAAKYADVISHVRYIGVGINPIADYAVTNPAAKQIATRMVKSGPWTIPPTLEAGITLTFPREKSIFTVSILGGKRGDHEVIQFQGNFHYPIDEKVGSKSAREAIEIITSNAEVDQKEFLTTTETWVEELS